MGKFTVVGNDDSLPEMASTWQKINDVTAYLVIKLIAAEFTSVKGMEEKIEEQTGEKKIRRARITRCIKRRPPGFQVSDLDVIAAARKVGAYQMIRELLDACVEITESGLCDEDIDMMVAATMKKGPKPLSEIIAKIKADRQEGTTTEWEASKEERKTERAVSKRRKPGR